jgi:hypothetical protein
LAEHSALKLNDGRQRVVRHGHAPERMIRTGIGPVTVAPPRVRDRAQPSTAESGSRRRSCHDGRGGPRAWTRSCRSCTCAACPAAISGTRYGPDDCLLYPARTPMRPGAHRGPRRRAGRSWSASPMAIGAYHPDPDSRLYGRLFLPSRDRCVRRTAAAHHAPSFRTLAALLPLPATLDRTIGNP